MQRYWYGNSAMKKLNIDNADILGFSNGGNTAMQLYHRHPVVVGKLILASAFYKREGMLPGFFEGMKDATLDNMPRELKDEFIKVNPDTAKLRNMFNKDKERMMNFRDWDDAVLTSIKVPTLIICGDKDVVVAQHAVAMSKLIANSRLMLLPSEHGTYIGVAEVPMYDSELVQLTARVIDNFLSNMP